MSLLKNPVVLALIVSALTFVVLTYFFSNKKSKSKDKEKKKSDNNEVIIISTAIAGLITWFASSSYFSSNESPEIVEQNIIDVNQQGGSNVKPQNAEISIKSHIMNNAEQSDLINTKNQVVPHINSEDPTRSYNLIGTNLNIPKTELKIPPVLIDINKK